MPFDCTIDSFYGSNIYNGDSIEIVTVTSLNTIDDSIFEEYYSSFDQVSSAYNGDFGVYTEYCTSSSCTIRIYNPSTLSNNVFYVEYIVHNVVVMHNDYAEIYYNIFDDSLNESINYLEAKITLPGVAPSLRVWAHGPLRGEIDPYSNYALLKIEGVNANTPID